ncbi:MAG: hypothetical protein ACJ8EL_08565 [Rhizomicrobium sp.]|jgi:hypothetical protein
MAMGRNIVALAAAVMACAAAQARDYYPDETSVPGIINFPNPPSATPAVKQFTNGTPIAFVGRLTFLNRDNRATLGRIVNPRITLTKNPDGTVLLTFDHVSMSGERERSGENGWFTGAAQGSLLGPNRGGIAWTIEIYDGTPNALPIYRWDWDAERLDHEEIKCGLAGQRRFSTVIRSRSPLPPHEIFNRAASVRAVAAPAEWTHC